MLNGWWKGERTGSGTIVWKAREEMAAGRIDDEEFIDIAASSAPSIGYCNTMGTASTMNSLAEALGMSLPGCAAIPAPYRERGQIAYETGKRIVEMVHEDLRPSDILTREAFENAIVVNSAIGGSTNAPIHINAIARHIGVELAIEDWETIGYDVPLLVNMQPAGEYLGEEYYRAGGVPAVVHELLQAPSASTPTRSPSTARPWARTSSARPIADADVIRPFNKPLKQKAGFIVLKGNLFDSRDHEDQRDLRRIPRALSVATRRTRTPSRAAPSCSTGRRTITTASTIRRSRSTSRRILFMRGAGPIGYPGSAEVVNMQPPAALIKRGITALPCIGDGRQSGTSGSPSILNASPEAAAGGGLALLKTGDRVRIDLNKGTRQHPDLQGGVGAAPRRRCRSTAATSIPPARRRGRKSSAAWSTSWPTAWC